MIGKWEASLNVIGSVLDFRKSKDEAMLMTV